MESTPVSPGGAGEFEGTLRGHSPEYRGILWRTVDALSQVTAHHRIPLFTNGGSLHAVGRGFKSLTDHHEAAGQHQFSVLTFFRTWCRGDILGDIRPGFAPYATFRGPPNTDPISSAAALSLAGIAWA